MGVHEVTLGRAAIAVLARDGGRGFTHRAVDRCAGLPEGTASRYARTRTALLTIAADAMFDEDRDQATEVLARRGQIQSRSRMVALLLRTTSALLKSPERYRARLELQLEAARSAELMQHLNATRAAFVDALAELLQPLGCAHPAHVADELVMIVEAILHRQLVLGQPRLSNNRMRRVFDTILEYG